MLLRINRNNRDRLYQACGKSKPNLSPLKICNSAFSLLCQILRMNVIRSIYVCQACQAYQDLSGKARTG